jgi:drug/metabolite transporter (DMT)-like permease
MESRDPVFANIIGGAVAVIAATVGSVALIAATFLSHLKDDHGQLVQERLPDLPMIGILLVVAILAAGVFGLPTVLLLKHRGWIALRSVAIAGVIVAVPLAVVWTWLMILAESSRPTPIIVYSYAAAVSLAMSLPACLAYWYVAER